MLKEQRDWLAELASSDVAVESAALASLREFLRRTLAKGFGSQLPDADLEELAQEATVRVHQKKASFNGNSRFTTWAAAIAVNLALSTLRRQRFKNVSLDDAAASGLALIVPPRAPGALAKAQLMGALSEAIETKLSERQREALHAKLSGMPMVEIARRQNTSVGALYKLLHDARKRLRASLEARGFDSSDPTSISAGEVT